MLPVNSFYNISLFFNRQIVRSVCLSVIIQILFFNKILAIDFERHQSKGYVEYRFAEVLAPLFFKMVDEKITYSSDKRKVLLTWAMSGKSENSHFEIERADDKNLNFKKIGSFPIQNWDGEVMAYQFEDDQFPVAGGRFYYRIKQLDINGNHYYGRTLSIEVIPSTYKPKEVWRAYPNPSKNGNFQIGLELIEEYSGEEITVRVIKGGDVLFHKKCFDLEDLNNYLGQNLKNISHGLVFVELNWGFHIQFLKVWNF